MITARLRIYGKNSTKISDNCQVQLEIRNFTDKPFRISTKTNDLSLFSLNHNTEEGHMR
jgi:hypothetical protein